MKKRINIASACALVIITICGFPALAGFDARVAGMGNSPYTGTTGEEMKLWCTYENLSTYDSGYDGKATFFLQPYLKEPGDVFGSAGSDIKEFMPYTQKTFDFQFIPRQNGTYQLRCEIWDPGKRHKFDGMTISFKVEENDPCAKISCPNYCDGNILHSTRLCLDGQCTNGATINCDNQDSEPRCSGKCRDGTEYVETCVWKDYSCVCDKCVGQDRSEDHGMSCICDDDSGCLPNDPCATIHCASPSHGSWTHYCEGNTLKKKRQVCDTYCDRQTRACVKDAASCDWEKITDIECAYQCQGDRCIQCNPDWNCADWNTCTQGQQVRVCRDKNNCQTNNDKPAEQQACAASCEFISGGWSTDTAADNEQVYLLLTNNGQCQGERARIEIWQKDWWKLLSKEFNVVLDNYIAPAGIFDRISWPAVFQKPSMVANWFDTCKGPCLKPTEYFFKIIYHGKEVVNTSKQSLLKVYPYYQDMTFEQYLQEVKRQVEEQEKTQAEFDYHQCIENNINNQGTLSGQCMRIFAQANVTPDSEITKEAWRAIGDWWNKGWEFWEPGYLMILASSCANCQLAHSANGGIFLQLAKAEQIASGGLNDQAFSDPFGIFGPQACQICTEGFLEALDNPQLMLAFLAEGVGKVIFTAAAKNVMRDAAIETFTYTVDKTGAQITYKAGKDTYLRELAFAQADGKIALRESLYKNPLWKLADAQVTEDFMLFNARYRLTSAGYLQSMSVAQENFMLALVKGYELDGTKYALSDVLPQSVQSLSKGRFGVKDVLTSLEFPETVGEYGEAFGKFIRGKKDGVTIHKIMQLSMKAPTLSFINSGTVIPQERVILGWVINHETSHAVITRFLETTYQFKTTVPPLQIKAAEEYFTDLLAIRTTNPDLEVVRAYFKTYHDLYGEKMLTAWLKNGDPGLLRIYNIAQETNYFDLMKVIKAKTNKKFLNAAKMLRIEGDLFVEQIFKNSDPKKFYDLLLKYKLIEPKTSAPLASNLANSPGSFFTAIPFANDGGTPDAEKQIMEAQYPQGCYKFPLRQEDSLPDWNITIAHAPDLQSCIDYTGNADDCTPVLCSDDATGCDCSMQAPSSSDFALYFVLLALFFATKRRKR